MIRHSVIVITYNQEGLLPICLDSIMGQDTLPYEVIIGDDCSTDDTWSVVSNYKARFPEVIKAVRNVKNLGIFANVNKMRQMVTGDVVSIIAGDDFFKPGLFSGLNEAIQMNNLDPINQSFLLVTNTVILHENGKEVIYDNYALKSCNLFKVRIRYGIHVRDVGLSRKFFDSLSPIREGLGYHSDWLYMIEQIVKCERFVFIDKAWAVYRLGQGVTSSIKLEELYKSKLKVIDIILSEYSERLDKFDVLFLKYWKARHKYLLCRSFRNYTKMVILQFSNVGNFTTNNSWFLNARLLLSGPLRAVKKYFIL